MWDSGETVLAEGSSATARIPRRIVDGCHEYPTAVARLPVGPGEKRTWALRIVRMANGLAVGLRHPSLKEGRVFGRSESVGQVWWLCNTGHLYNGNSLVKKEGLGFGGGVSSKDLLFGAGDTVQVTLDSMSLSFRVNQGKTSEPIKIEGLESLGPEANGLKAEPVLYFSVQMLDQGDRVELLEADPEVIIEGELEKRPSSTIMLNRFQPRWFQLTRKGLIYRTEREDEAGKLFEVSGVEGFEKVGQLNLSISHTAKEFFVKASSRNARDAWYKALDVVINEKRGPPITGPNAKKPQSGREGSSSPMQTGGDQSDYGSLLSVETLQEEEDHDDIRLAEPVPEKTNKNGFRPKALEIRSAIGASATSAAHSAWMTPKGERGISRTPSGSKNMIKKFIN